MQTEIDHLLTCLAEEAVEVAQRVCKIQRFGIDEIQEGKTETNRKRLEGELKDLLGVMDMLIERDVLNAEIYNDFIAAQLKENRVLKYMDYARQKGTLEPKVD